MHQRGEKKTEIAGGWWKNEPCFESMQSISDIVVHVMCRKQDVTRLLLYLFSLNQLVDEQKKNEEELIKQNSERSN